MPRRLADIKSLARTHTATVIRVFAGIVREPTAPPAARVMAGKELLDRGWGKALATAEVTVTHVKAAELSDDQLAAIVRGDVGSDVGEPSPTIN